MDGTKHQLQTAIAFALFLAGSIQYREDEEHINHIVHCLDDALDSLRRLRQVERRSK